MKKYEEINSTLGYMFNSMMAQNPPLMDHLPDNAVVIMQIEGHDTFNAWAKKISIQHLEKGQKIVYAIFRLRPRLTPQQITPQKIVTSRVEDLELQPA